LLFYYSHAWSKVAPEILLGLLPSSRCALLFRGWAAWYQTLAKPPFNPPDWVFAPVWTILYVMIAIAGWRVWRKAGIAGAKRPLAAYGLQLVLNFGWSVLFFGVQRTGWALAEVVVLLVVIVATWWLFRPIDKPAAFLFVPYGLWVAFATVLNLSIVILNP
jgi:benzodiazapine receptor